MSTLKKVVTAQNIPLKTATVEDFNHNGKRKIGLNYFLQNSKDRLECYSVTANTDNEHVKKFIAAGRCFIINTVVGVDYGMEVGEG